MSAEAPLPEVCRKCEALYVPGVEPDPCLGELPGVTEACCGHGSQHKAYCVFPDGTVFRRFRVEFFGEAKERWRGLNN